MHIRARTLHTAGTCAPVMQVCSFLHHLHTAFVFLNLPGALDLGIQLREQIQFQAGWASLVESFWPWQDCRRFNYKNEFLVLQSTLQLAFFPWQCSMGIFPVRVALPCIFCPMSKEYSFIWMLHNVSNRLLPIIQVGFSFLYDITWSNILLRHCTLLVCFQVITFCKSKSGMNMPISRSFTLISRVVSVLLFVCQRAHSSTPV